MKVAKPKRSYSKKGTKASRCKSPVKVPALPSWFKTGFKPTTSTKLLTTLVQNNQPQLGQHAEKVTENKISMEQ